MNKGGLSEPNMLPDSSSQSSGRIFEQHPESTWKLPSYSVDSRLWVTVVSSRLTQTASMTIQTPARRFR